MRFNKWHLLDELALVHWRHLIMRTFPKLCILLILVALAVFTGSVLLHGQTSSNDQGREPNKFRLQNGWQIQSSCKVAEKAEFVSTISFKPQERCPATGPRSCVWIQ